VYPYTRIMIGQVVQLVDCRDCRGGCSCYSSWFFEDDWWSMERV